MNSLISVIVPVYKVEPFLHKCIDSIINQSYKNLEIVLINDGSPDNCGKICDDYASKDSRIKVIHQQNKGLSGARNAGLDLCIGDYVSFVDSDDWIEYEMYEEMLGLLLEHKLDMVECDVNRTSEVNQNKNIETQIRIENSLEALKRIIKTSCFSVWRRLYKREVIENSRFLLNKTSEDIYFTIDLVQEISSLGYINLPFYNYRSNPDSIMKSGYSRKRLKDSIDGSLYLQNVLAKIKDNQLQLIIINHMLLKLLLHYKLLNYHSQLDSDYTSRNYVRKLIKSNYSDVSDNHIELKLARYLPIKYFYLLTQINTLKHKVLDKSKFFIFFILLIFSYV